MLGWIAFCHSSADYGAVRTTERAELWLDPDNSNDAPTPLVGASPPVPVADDLRLIKAEHVNSGPLA